MFFDFMNTFEQYGFTQENLAAFILGCDPSLIQQKVVLAPCWKPESVGIKELQRISPRIWDCKISGIPFTYIICGIGAGHCSDIVMSLEKTCCKKILFIGSAGSINKNIAVGDLVVPDYIMCGDGLCRYLSKNLKKDCFGVFYSPTASLQKYIYEAASIKSSQDSSLCFRCHSGKGASVETLYSQFQHLKTFREMQCDFLDMESAAFLKSAGIAGIESALVFCISDNAICQQSLVTVSEEATSFRKNIRYQVMPVIISAFLHVKGFSL